MPIVRPAGLVLFALALANCAGGAFGPSAPEQPKAPAIDMAGRWILAAPGSPSCGMNFSAAKEAGEGTIAPEGGCPGNFFTSRHWALEKDNLTINDHENQPLAQLKFDNGRFAGQATAGMPVSLSR